MKPIKCNQENQVRISGSDRKVLLTAFFVLTVVFGFGLAKVESASAADVYCGYLISSMNPVTGMPDTHQTYKKVSDEAACDKLCKENNSEAICKKFTNEAEAKQWEGGEGKKAAETSNEAAAEPTDGLLTSAFKWILRAVLYVIGWFIAIAATLFEWIIQPSSLNAVMSNPVIYQTWMLVRDTLNVAFILVLLFSAFATIFQVSKFSYKNILLTLVIMALLVNFSFPIARVIIDFSNVIMYYFLNSLGGSGTGAFSQIADKGDLAKILKPDESADITFLIAAIIFSFIFAVTILAIAILLIIRTIALAILIIFSPLAFVGSIVPFLSGHASKWWDNLFKYSFFGPIMIFMIYIATKMVSEISLQKASFVSIAGVQSGGSISQFIAAGSFFAIPIVILWIGIGTAQSMSIAGAGAVMGSAQKFMKGAGKKFSGYNFGKSQYDAYSASRKKRKDEIQKGRFLGTVGNKINKWQDVTVGKIPLVGGSAKKRAEKMRKDANKDDIDKGAKDLIDKGATTDSLAIDVNNAFNTTPTTQAGKVDQAKQAAAYLRQDADERKMHVQNTITAAGGVTGSDLENVLNAPAPPRLVVGSAGYNAYMNARNEAQLAAIAIAGGTFNENDIRKVTTFVNRQMKSKVETGANA